MNYLLARIRDRHNGMKILLSNQNIYDLDNLFEGSNVLPYSPADAIEESEWYYLEKFSAKSYCPDIIKEPFDGTDFAAITRADLDVIAYLCYVHDGETFCFQRVSKSQLLKRKRVVFAQEVKYEEDSQEIVINLIPDAIYRKNEDRLYFKKLSSITAIFHGIDEVFREATEEETLTFLKQEFVVLGSDFTSKNVKQPNRKRLALAKEAMDGYDKEQKTAVLRSIRDYYPSIINDDNTFKIETDDDLTYLLYGILQRYYTTADGREKRIASAVRAIN